MSRLSLIFSGPACLICVSFEQVSHKFPQMIKLVIIALFSGRCALVKKEFFGNGLRDFQVRG